MDEVVKKLEALGFTNYESRVFYALFQGHIMTASEVAKDARIPRSSAYDILKSFSEKGICNEILTATVAQYELIDPKIVEDKIEKEIHQTYESKITMLRKSFEELLPIYKSKERESRKTDVELIKGFNKHRDQKFKELLKSSKEEVLLMVKLQGLISPEMEREAIQFIKRGGSIRSVYEASLNFKLNIKGEWRDVTPEALIEICESFQKQGEQVRLTPNVPQNIAIFDRRVVFVSLVDPTIPKNNRSDVIVKNENYAQFMVEHFNNYWEKSYTLEEYKNKLKS